MVLIVYHSVNGGKGKKQEDEQRGRTRWTFKLTMLTKLDTYLKRDQSILLLCTNINLNLL